jgi:hypothetical protein
LEIDGVLNPKFPKYLYCSKTLLILPSSKKTEYKKQSKFLFATIEESCSLSVPEAEFLGFEKSGRP